MTSLTSTMKRVLLAGAFAVALTVAPGAAILSPAAVQQAPTTLADSSSDGCTSGESVDAYSLACVPDIVPNSIGGAPSEMDLTEGNPGVASPTDHGGH
jgi:hypothetical protein